jgi:hypothetical protein
MGLFFKGSTFAKQVDLISILYIPLNKCQIFVYRLFF